ncbi:MAG: NERD domain-containing protein [Chloroflexi bacterium]|nr:NERD domain-containing protein [Chloroflexota bacterium]
MRVFRSRSQRFRHWRYTRQRQLLLWLTLSFFALIGTTVAVATVARESWIFMVLAGMLVPFALALAASRGTMRSLEADLREGRAVTEALKGDLNESFVLLNGLAIRGASDDVDHVLAGPTGVFVIESRGHSGYVRCKGDVWSRRPSRSAGRQRQVLLRSPARAALKAASAVTETLEDNHLEVPVTPLVVFTNRDLALSVTDTLVPVLRLAELPSVVKAPRPCLTVAQVDLIASVLTSPRSRRALSSMPWSWHA